MKASLSDGTRKASCIRILNLERNAQRWYGVNCRAYFLATLPQRVERMGGTKEAWEEEVRILEKAMFSLSEAGGGGTPRIFEDAQDTCGEQVRIDENGRKWKRQMKVYREEERCAELTYIALLS
jgi:hypothetical protein